MIKIELHLYLFQRMYPNMKTFVCNESQEVLSIFDYQPSNKTSRYKANRNGLQVVIQFTATPNSSQMAIHSDLNNFSLCKGILEEGFLGSVNDHDDIAKILGQVLIESLGTDIVYRSRDCHQMVDKSSDICSSCHNLLMAKPQFKQVHVIKKRKLEEKEDDHDLKIETGDISDEENYLDDNEHFLKEESDSFNDEHKSSTQVIGIIKKEDEEEPDEAMVLVCPRSNCDLTFSSDKEMKLHIATEHKKKRKVPIEDMVLECQHFNCDATFSSVDEMKLHNRTVHVAGTKGRFKEKCPFCNSLMMHNERLHIHVMTEHVDQRDNPIFGKLMKERGERVHCDQCGEKFLSKDILTKHIAIKHDPSLNPETCDVCGRRFKTASSLRIHMACHDENEVLCGVCGKTLKNQNALKNHQRHHQTHTCKDCGRTFKRGNELRTHIRRVHLEIFDHQCETCSKDFKCSRDLKRHILSIHEQIKPWICQHCGYKCSRYANLHVHRKTVHGSEWMPRSEFRKLIEDGKNPYCAKLDYDEETLNILD